MNKQSNTYTILYAAIMVIVVGAVLALTYGALKPKQDENIAVDKMKQILSAVHVVANGNDEIRDSYNKYITESFIVDVEGNVISNDADAAFKLEMAKELKKERAERQLPVFVFTDNDKKDFVVPVSGAGLWGPIWGYVAIESDGSTIFGAYFSHASETPGLGAEIEKPAFQNEFNGKELFKNNVFIPVEVMKAGQVPTSGADYVDAISGGTITSKGVQAMLNTCLTDYSKFLTKIKNESSK